MRSHEGLGHGPSVWSDRSRVQRCEQSTERAAPKRSLFVKLRELLLEERALVLQLVIEHQLLAALLLLIRTLAALRLLQWGSRGSREREKERESAYMT